MIVAVACLGTASAVLGDEFYSIQSIESSTATTDFFPVDELIEGPGVGFGATEPHNSTDGSGFRFWVTVECGFPCDYYETFPSPPVLVIDLGQERELDEISIWTYFVDNSGKDFVLRFATNAEGPTAFGTSISYTPTFTSPEVNEVPRQSFAFREAVRARYVEMTITDNFFQGDGTSGGDRVGLGEIAFAIPDRLEEQILVTSPRDFEAVLGTVDSSLLSAIPFTFEGNSIADNYWSAALDSITGDIYFSVPTEGRIYRGNVNDASLTLELFVEREGAVFHGMAFDGANGNLLVLDSKEDVILTFQGTTGSSFGILGGGIQLQRPNELLLDRNRIIVSDSGLDTIQIFSRIGARLFELDHPSTVGVWGLAVDPETGDVVYSSHDLGQVWRWSPDAGSAPSLIADGLMGPRGLGYDRRGRLFCVESGAGRVTTLGESMDLEFSTACGGRDLSLFADCDLNGNFLPDEVESTVTNPFLLRNSNFFGNVDGDAFLNGLEVALGENPFEFTSGPGFEFVVDERGLFTVEHLALKKSDYQYRLLLSDDLVNWEAASTLPLVTGGAGLYDTWTFPVDAALEGFPSVEKIFVRVGVNITE